MLDDSKIRQISFIEKIYPSLLHLGDDNFLGFFVKTEKDPKGLYFYKDKEGNIKQSYVEKTQAELIKNSEWERSIEYKNYSTQVYLPTFEELKCACQELFLEIFINHYYDEDRIVIKNSRFSKFYSPLLVGLDLSNTKDSELSEIIDLESTEIYSKLLSLYFNLRYHQKKLTDKGFNWGYLLWLLLGLIIGVSLF